MALRRCPDDRLARCVLADLLEEDGHALAALVRRWAIGQLGPYVYRRRQHRWFCEPAGTTNPRPWELPEAVFGSLVGRPLWREYHLTGRLPLRCWAYPVYAGQPLPASRHYLPRTAWVAFHQALLAELEP